MMKGIFLDADEEMAAIFERVGRPGDPPVHINLQARVAPEELAGLTDGYDFVVIDHTQLPTEAMRACKTLKHVVFLGTGARSYMHPDELAAIGITVHIIKGYGDTAVAEHSIAMMWAGARGIAAMDTDVRGGRWIRQQGMQLTGKTIGLLGYGGIAGEVARIAGGSGMKVLAWNRTPKTAPGVTFVSLDTLLAESQVLSVHLLLTDETRHFLGAERIAKLRPGVLLVNTARGAVIDEAAMVAALKSGHIAHAALDVFDQEPLPQDNPLVALPNVTLAAHAGFYTPEANETLLRRALDIAVTLAAG
jgi:D-3-phosphoglycerate dehydrogenase